MRTNIVHVVVLGSLAVVGALVIACSSSDTGTSSGGGSSSGGSSSGGSSGSSSGSSGSNTSSSGASGSSQSSSCSLFTCTNTAGCGGLAPCMSTSTGKNYCYAQAANAADCESGTIPTTKMVDGLSRTLCIPNGCPDPDTYLP